jgi:hypothetical protein
MSCPIESSRIHSKKGSRDKGMAFRQFVAASLAVLLALGSAPLLAQQGAISGTATDEADAP